MKRGGLLAITAAGICATLTIVASPSQGATGLTAAAAPAVAAPSPCSYPPVRTPALTLASSVPSVRPLVRFTLSGTLKVNSCGLKNWPVGIFASQRPNGTYFLVATTKTNAQGAYSFGYAQLVTQSYRTASAAGSGYNSATSSTVTVTRK